MHIPARMRSSTPSHRHSPPGSTASGLDARDTVTSYFYLPLTEQTLITAPLDALEHPPAGYRRDHRSTVVTGMDFERAASALRSGEVHRRAGLQISTTETPLREGTEVICTCGSAARRSAASSRPAACCG